MKLIHINVHVYIMTMVYYTKIKIIKMNLSIGTVTSSVRSSFWYNLIKHKLNNIKTSLCIDNKDTNIKKILVVFINN